MDACDGTEAVVVLDDVTNSVFLESRNFPNSYPYNEGCTWIIKAQCKDVSFCFILNFPKRYNVRNCCLHLKGLHVDRSVTLINESIYCVLSIFALLL